MSGSLCRRLSQQQQQQQRRQPCEVLESRVLLASTTTLTPVADAYVRDGASAASNFGSDPALMVKGSPTVGNTRRTYLKFDVSSFTEADAVTLRLFGSSSASSPSVSLAAHAVADIGWSEGTINWNNKPLLGASLSTRTISGTSDTTYEWNVTSHVQAAIAAGADFVSLAVAHTTSTTSNPTAEFDAREGAVDPQLVITTDDEEPPPPPPDAALRIDAAGGPTFATGGVLFAADAGFTGGFANTGTFAVAGTTDDALYSTRRTGDFTYDNAVPNGDYTLNLLFADHYTSAGQRRFNVSVEGDEVLSNFDIVAEAGSKTALVKSFPVTVVDGMLNMNFASVVGFASLSAFELIPEGDPPPPPAPSFSINNVSNDEGDAGTTPFTFTITRGGDATVPVSVQYSTLDQTADDASDYDAASAVVVSFAAGETSKQITVDVNGDTDDEPNETFHVTLSNPTGGATIADATGVGTIENDDAVVGVPASLAIADASKNEGNSGTSPLVFTVTRTGDTSTAVTVNWATQNQTAGEGDYQVATGSLSFAPGQTSRTISISIKGDTKVENNETFAVNLTNSTGASIADGVAVGTIVNDDAGTVGISDITWTRNAPRSPLPRTEAGVAQVGSKVYAIGGFNAQGGTGTFFPITRRVHVYDMATRQWSELASLPSQAPANHSGVATDGTNIYVVAGQITDTYGAGTATTWRYNIASNQWTQFVSLPAIRFGGTAFIDNGFLHYVGGDEADRETITTTHWRINLSDPSGGWQTRAPIPLGGDHMSHAAIGGKHYIFGGEHDHHSTDPDDDAGYIQHNYTFEYNAATDTWARKADMPLALSHVEGSTLVINGKAVLIGGLLTGGDPNLTNRVHVYDPVANSWRTLSTRFPKRVDGPTAGYWNGKIYMTDGYSPDESDRQVGFEGTVIFG